MQDPGGDSGGWSDLIDALSEAPMALLAMVFLFVVARWVFKDISDTLQRHALEMLRETARILREANGRKKGKHDDDST